LDFADTVVDEQPAVFRQDGWSSAADLEPFPRRDWRCQAMMKGKLAGVKGLTVKCHLAVRNPDALSIDIHFTGRRATGGFLGASAWKKGPVEHCQLGLTGRIGDDGWEKAGILVVHLAE